MMDSFHPVRRAMTVLRFWLSMVVVIMTVNANSATGYLLGPSIKPVPFYLLALVALIWASRVWDMPTIICCCSVIVVGTGLRGLEVLFYADAFTLAQRLTGVTLWWFISGTSLAFGVLSLMAASRREVEELIYDGPSSNRRR